EQRPHVRTPTQLGDSVRQLRRAEADVVLAPLCGERKKIALRAVTRINFDDVKEVSPLIEARERMQRKVTDLLVLGGEPALKPEEFGQHPVVELPCVAVGYGGINAPVSG